MLPMLRQGDGAPPGPPPRPSAAGERARGTAAGRRQGVRACAAPGGRSPLRGSMAPESGAQEPRRRASLGKRRPCGLGAGTVAVLPSPRGRWAPGQLGPGGGRRFSRRRRDAGCLRIDIVAARWTWQPVLESRQRCHTLQLGPGGAARPDGGDGRAQLCASGPGLQAGRALAGLVGGTGAPPPLWTPARPARRDPWAGRVLLSVCGRRSVHAAARWG